MLNSISECLSTMFRPAQRAWTEDPNFKTVVAVSLLSMAIIFTLSCLHAYAEMPTYLFWIGLCVTVVCAASKLIPLFTRNYDCQTHIGTYC